MADRERLLEIAGAMEGAQYILEQQADTAALGAGIGFALGRTSGTASFTKEFLDLSSQARVAKLLKLEALNEERQMRWGGM